MEKNDGDVAWHVQRFSLLVQCEGRRRLQARVACVCLVVNAKSVARHAVPVRAIRARGGFKGDGTPLKFHPPGWEPSGKSDNNCGSKTTSPLNHKIEFPRCFFKARNKLLEVFVVSKNGL